MISTMSMRIRLTSPAQTLTGNANIGSKRLELAWGRAEEECHWHAYETHELHGESDEVSEVAEGWSQYRQVGKDGNASDHL